MSLYGLFIGVDKHQAPDIRELGGAKRDAVALSCLFRDSIPAMNIETLIDEAATTAAVRSQLTHILTAAGPSDSLILTFSGHGTRDHRLVTHDTDTSDLPNTTIDMTELADLFRQSQAGAIVCVLDCCFSGAAPARVLEQSPPTREPVSPLTTLAGTGRILLSAAGVNQYALEHPQNRHGLLTLALIDALQKGSEPTDLLSLVSTIQATVRAQALAMGYDQEPAILGHLQTSLVLPPLRRGASYLAAFPDTAWETVTTFADLTGLIPAAVISEWQATYPQGPNELAARRSQ